MKKILTLVFALLLSIGVSAQTELTEAVNFTSTAHNGEEIDLFEILNDNQYALIYFYSESTPRAGEYVAKLVDAYYSLGCNSEDIYFMQVSPSDTKESTNKWIEKYHIPFPSIHTETEGDTGETIRDKYQIKGWPTTVLIAPDKSIVLQDIYPMPTAEELVAKFTTEFAIEEKSCADAQTPEVAIAKTRVNMEDGQGTVLEASTKVHVDFRANAATEKFYYTSSESANLTSEDVITNGTLAESKEFSHTFEGLTASTKYFVYAQAIGADDANGTKSVIETRTLCQGGEGDVEIELSVIITSESVIATAIPNAATSEYHYGFVKKEYYEASEVNQFSYLSKLANDNYPMCDTSHYDAAIKNAETGAPQFAYNTPYYVVAIGRNGEGQWFAPIIKEFMIEVASGPAKVDLSVNRIASTITISATPNDFAVEYHFDIVKKSNYDSFGLEAVVEQLRNDGNPFYYATFETWTIDPYAEYVAVGTAKNANNEWGETTVIFSTEEALVELEANFNIYPNPAKSMVNIESSLKGEAQVNIFDMTGRCVKEVSVSDMSNVSINVEDLNKGVYFISIQQDNSNNIQKLVIE